MSNVAINPTAPLAGVHAGHNGDHPHDPHLAHHFDTPAQQYASAKLGMWVFLGTEILMFGGLFCAYAVYRHNHPDVFAFAHQFLDRWLGALNTLVLITSSLTMAWAVRSSQLGHQTSLRWLLAATILGGYGFLAVKSIEYHTKWQHHLFIGEHNQFRSGYAGPKTIEEEEKEAAKKSLPGGGGVTAASSPMISASAVPGGAASGPQASLKLIEPGHPGVGSASDAAGAPVASVADSVSINPPDPNAGSPDQAKIRPPFTETEGLAPRVIAEKKNDLELSDLSQPEKERLYTFFGIYFFMTGLHGVHVVVGMSLIAWVLIRALGPKNATWAVPMIPGSIGLFLSVVGIIVSSNALIMWGIAIAVLSVVWSLLWTPFRKHASAVGEFGPTYFTPVDLVGLYWHLVDLIWIFLFPLLYLIH